MTPVGIGLIGCGNISDAYLKGAANSRLITVEAVADRDGALATEKAERYGTRALTVDALLAEPSIALVINLTPPAAHQAVCEAVLLAGKHVYSEKPLTVSVASARALLERGDALGLRVGCAPDTFLGAGHQRVRRLIDEGAIGTVLAGAVTFANAGPDLWHPDPGFFFQPGGGPVLDIGCYPITQLVNCLGSVESVVALASSPRATRRVGAGPRAGSPIKVEIATTVNGALAFAGGANVAFTASWDVAAHQRQPIEFYGTAGTIINPDPNYFGGPVFLSTGGKFDKVPLGPLPFGAENMKQGETMRANYRIAGVLDMVRAIETGREHRASGRLALHVLEVMEGLEASARDGRRVEIASRCDRPAAVPDGVGEEVFG